LDRAAPKRLIVTAMKLALGMAFGGAPLLDSTIAELVAGTID
jgi:hypothetical protein